MYLMLQIGWRTFLFSFANHNRLRLGKDRNSATVLTNKKQFHIVFGNFNISDVPE